MKFMFYGDSAVNMNVLFACYINRPTNGDRIINDCIGITDIIRIKLSLYIYRTILEDDGILDPVTRPSGQIIWPRSSLAFRVRRSDFDVVGASLLGLGLFEVDATEPLVLVAAYLEKAEDEVPKRERNKREEPIINSLALIAPTVNVWSFDDCRFIMILV